MFWPRQAACGILVHWPGIKPAPPAVEAWSPNHWTAREFPLSFFLSIYRSIYLPIKMLIAHPRWNVYFRFLKNFCWGLPWWRSGWESACQFRGHGFEPWSGRIPCAAEQLGLWATITEPARLEPVLRNKRGRDSERPAHRNEEWPLLATTRESPRTETKTQHSHK